MKLGLVELKRGIISCAYSLLSIFRQVIKVIHIIGSVTAFHWRKREMNFPAAWRYRGVLGMMAFIMPMLLNAQAYHLTWYNSQNGLPTDQVRHVVQDDSDQLWIATDQGLVHTDGQNFQLFQHELASQYCRYFWQDEEQIVFSHDAGLSSIQPGPNGPLIEGLQGASIVPKKDALYYPSRLYRDRQGQLWVSQADGSVGLLKEGQFHRISLEEGEQRPQFFFGETETGDLYVVSSNGKLYLRDKASDKIVEAANLGRAIYSFCTHNDQLYLGLSDGVQQLELAGDSWRKTNFYPTENARVNALAIDSSHSLFLGLQDQGLFYLDLERQATGSAKLLRVYSNNDPHRVDELPFRQINEIVLGKNGAILVCAEEGLGILRKRFFESVRGLPNGNTMSLAFSAAAEGYVNFGDVFRLHPTHVGYRAETLDLSAAGTVNSVFPTANRSWWVGNSNGDLYRLNAQNQVQERYDFTERGNGIFYLLEDRQQRLWFCQAPEDQPIIGIGCILPDGQKKEYGKAEGLDNRILVIRESAQGRIYAGGIGQSTYLYRYLPEEDVFVNLSLPFDFYVSPNFEVHDLTIDQDGVVWLATTDGLLRYDGDRVRNLDLVGYQADLEVRAVTHLDDGSIWIATDTEGILYYQDGELLSLGEESGLPSKVMAYRALSRGPDGRLWAGTAEGLVYSYHPAPQPATTAAPWINSILRNEKEVGSNKLQLQTKDQLDLSLSSNGHYGFRTFYSYQLNGADWSKPNSSPQISLMDLSAGDYQLAVRAKKEGGYQWSVPLQLSFEVAKPWWQRSSTQLTVVLAAIVFFFAWYRWKRGKYRARIDQLRKALAGGEKPAIMQRTPLAQLHSLLRGITPESSLNDIEDRCRKALISFPEIVDFQIIRGLTELPESPKGSLLSKAGSFRGEAVTYQIRGLEGVAFTEEQRLLFDLLTTYLDQIPPV
ncbi:MAG: hypothetical protein AAF433_01065 [Bacteroidota bacterium]